MLFYTNASECVNSVIKVKVQYKKSELPQFISKLHELCEEQEREVERAVLQRGKYRLRPQYRVMEISESKWFKMTHEQRSQHLKKLHEMPVFDVADVGLDGTNELSPTPTVVCTPASLTQELATLTTHLGLPISAIEAIASKASDILSVAGGVVVAPGQPTARMVLSKTGKRPHFVVKKKNGGLACDSDCPQYKSASLCSHIVAAAKHDMELPELVSSYQNVKRCPNLTKLAVSGMPKGRGHKGSKAPRRRKEVPVENRYELSIPSEGTTKGASVSSDVMTSSVMSSLASSSTISDSMAGAVVHAPITSSVLNASIAGNVFSPSVSPYYSVYLLLEACLGLVRHLIHHFHHCTHRIMQAKDIILNYLFVYALLVVTSVCAMDARESITKNLDPLMISAFNMRNGACTLLLN